MAILSLQQFSKGGPVTSSSQSHEQMVAQLNAEPSLGSRIGGVIQDAGAGVAQGLQGSGSLSGDISGGIGATGSAIGAIPKVAAQFLPKSVRDLAGYVGGGLSKGFKSITDPIAGTKLFQEAGKYPEQTKVLEDYLSAGGSLGDIANNILAIGGTAGAVDSAVSKVKGTVSSAVQDVKPLNTPSFSPSIEKIKAEWTRPTETPKPTFNGARAVLEQDKTVPEFLAKQGIDPRVHIEDGRYTTTDTAAALRADAGKLSKETLRPSLKIADYSTPKTPLEEAKNLAIQKAKKEFGVTSTNREAIIADIEKEFASLQKQHPDGLGLVDMHDGKITYAENAGYHPLKAASENNTAVANRNIASAFQDLVEKKAPPEVPVGDFNSYLSKYYRSADYLDALNTKVAPVTLGQQIARGVAKFGGASLGAHLGGGIVSEFAGYQIGKAIELALENLTGPARQAFISNLEKTNPEAFLKVEKYLRETGTGANGMLALPAPTSDTPIPLQGRTPTSGVEIVPAEKLPLPVQNTKTGKMQRQYISGTKK